MYRLCNADISKLEQITKLNLLEAFTWLSYETDFESQSKQVKYEHDKQIRHTIMPLTPLK